MLLPWIQSTIVPLMPAWLIVATVILWLPTFVIGFFVGTMGSIFYIVGTIIGIVEGLKKLYDGSALVSCFQHLVWGLLCCFCANEFLLMCARGTKPEDLAGTYQFMIGLNVMAWTLVLVAIIRTLIPAFTKWLKNKPSKETIDPKLRRWFKEKTIESLDDRIAILSKQVGALINSDCRLEVAKQQEDTIYVHASRSYIKKKRI